jgi:predicted HicB family RNase H-like nuclease
MNVMTHKNYAARIEYSDEDACFVGRVTGIRDIVSFHGETVSGLRAAFEEALDFYLASCAARSEKPNKPYSGKLMLRVDPSVHARVAMLADASGKSINQWAAEVFTQGS